MEKAILIIMDLIVIFALSGTIYFMRQVYGSIKVIREGRTELQQLLQQMNLHISNAQHSIDNMNKLADDKAKMIQKQIENASAAIEELQFIQRAADNVAKRLENATDHISSTTNAHTNARTEPSAKQSTKPMSKAEKELADAMAARRAKAAGE